MKKIDSDVTPPVVKGVFALNRFLPFSAAVAGLTGVCGCLLVFVSTSGS